jgi:hypothetical protein
MTRTLHNLALARPNHKLHLRALIEGPYPASSLQPYLGSYGTVILFAGGVGITHQILHIRHLLSLYAMHSCATRKIVLYWVVKDTRALDWVREWFDEILAMEGRRDIFKLIIYVTRPRNPREIKNVSPRIRLVGGRPNVGMIVEKEAVERVGAMTVGVCGPGGLADDVREKCREVCAWKDNVALDFWEEGFSM